MGDTPILGDDRPPVHRDDPRPHLPAGYLAASCPICGTSWPCPVVTARQGERW